MKISVLFLKINYSLDYLIFHLFGLNNIHQRMKVIIIIKQRLQHRVKKLLIHAIYFEMDVRLLCQYLLYLPMIVVSYFWIIIICLWIWNFLFVEIHCDRLTSDDRFFSNLFRLLVTIEQSSLTNEDKFDALALVCLYYFSLHHFSFLIFCFLDS